MFARSVSIHVKPNRMREYRRVVENEAIPFLRRQRGFQDELTLFMPGGSEVVEISLWDRREDADVCSRSEFQGVFAALGDVIEGNSEVRIYAVSNSTFHKIAAPVFDRR